MTKNAVQIVFAIEALLFSGLTSSAFESTSLKPIYRTKMLPAEDIRRRSHMNLSMIAPIPKKHAEARDISKKITMNDTARTLGIRTETAELITNTFCIPIGAAYANPAKNP